MCTLSVSRSTYLPPALTAALIEQLREGVAVHAADGQLVEWNAAAAAITGWSRVEASERFPRALPDGLHALDGRWLDVRQFVLDDEEPLALTLFEDATALLALRESESRWQAAFEASAVGMVLLTPDGRFTRVNAALCRLLGYAAEELLGRNFIDFTHPDDIALDHQRTASLLRGETLAPDREKRYIHRLGHVVWVTVGAALVRDEHGGSLIVGQVIDITARKLAESATRDSEERFRALNAAAPVGIYLTDVQGHCLYVNARWQAIAGLTLTESLGANWARAIHPDDRGTVFDAWQAAVDEEREFLLEFRFRTPEGAVRWVRSRTAAIRSSATGAPTGFVGTVEDISEQRLAAEALATFAAQLEVKTREQEAFIYTVSHDLRAPLVSIQGLAGLLAEDYAAQLDDDGQHFINRIVLNVTRMNALLDELLTLSRIGSVDLEREQVDLGLLWDIVVEQFAQQLAARGADIASAGKLPTVTANPTRMMQVFQNLLENALNYTPAERAPVVRVTTLEHPEYWEVLVTDQGIGVPPAFRRKLFEIFQRLPEGKMLHPDGNGVGLAVVKRVVETHGGEIWVDEAPGGGAAFHFTLPKA